MKHRHNLADRVATRRSASAIASLGMHKGGLVDSARAPARVADTTTTETTCACWTSSSPSSSSSCAARSPIAERCASGRPNPPSHASDGEIALPSRALVRASASGVAATIEGKCIVVVAVGERMGGSLGCQRSGVALGGGRRSLGGVRTDMCMPTRTAAPTKGPPGDTPPRTKSEEATDPRHEPMDHAGDLAPCGIFGRASDHGVPTPAAPGDGLRVDPQAPLVAPSSVAVVGGNGDGAVQLVRHEHLAPTRLSAACAESQN